MNSSKVGQSISKPEITNISKHGIWIYVVEKEYFIPFDKFPWLKEGKLYDLMEVELFNGYHLHWPKLDIDLTINQIENPDQYPLIYKAG